MQLNQDLEVFIECLKVVFQLSLELLSNGSQN